MKVKFAKNVTNNSVELNINKLVDTWHCRIIKAKINLH